MNALALVLAGHLTGDWVAQTDWQAANKASSWRAMQAHMLTYHGCLAAALAFGGLSAVAFVAVLAVSWLTHSFIDRRWPVVTLMRATGSGPFSQTTFGVVAVDQALHLSILCVLVAVVGQ